MKLYSVVKIGCNYGNLYYVVKYVLGSEKPKMVAKFDNWESAFLCAYQLNKINEVIK